MVFFGRFFYWQLQLLELIGSAGKTFWKDLKDSTEPLFYVRIFSLFWNLFFVVVVYRAEDILSVESVNWWIVVCFISLHLFISVWGINKINHSVSKVLYWSNGWLFFLLSIRLLHELYFRLVVQTSTDFEWEIIIGVVFYLLATTISYSQLKPFKKNIQSIAIVYLFIFYAFSIGVIRVNIFSNGDPGLKTVFLSLVFILFTGVLSWYFYHKSKQESRPDQQTDLVF